MRAAFARPYAVLRVLFDPAVPAATCTGSRYSVEMVITLRHKGLKRLFEKDSPSGVHANRAGRIRDVFAHLDRGLLPAEHDLPGYGLHALKGILQGY